jgi:phosphoribosylaminoimidazolecarboxamide formyltransferase/IMP cyclohydrolase
MNNENPIRRALLSVSDKTGLIKLGLELNKFGVEILSTGGSAKALSDAGISVKEVSSHTDFPEMMDGRVKTLHPKIHGGILALRDKDQHQQAMSEHDIAPIDLVVINLYPFEQTVESGADSDTIIENIDIGGPAMIRSAAKNHAFVTVVVEPADYDDLIRDMNENNGATSFATRKKLAAKAYTKTGSYDTAISNWFQSQLGNSQPDTLLISATKQQALRYGENPHQSATFYKTRGNERNGVANAEQIQGKELSYNNLNDTDAAFELVSEFDENIAIVAIIKHANPCGVARGENLTQAYKKALACDPISAFGGIVATNQHLDETTAIEIIKVFTEVVIAPSICDKAKAILATKKNIRVLETSGMAGSCVGGTSVKSIAGGFLVQDSDAGKVSESELKVVSKRQPSKQEMEDMLFAFLVSKHVKSNAIVYVRDGMTVGVGAGQMNRRDSSRIAAMRGGEAAEIAGESVSFTEGSVVASDAFFPFADGLLAAAEAGATAVIQPGGSMRDDEVIKAADEAGLAMVLTGMRHFRH